MDWKPIETANLQELDDSMERILVSDGRSVAVVTADLGYSEPQFTDELGCDHELFGKPPIGFEPTHWARFPSPPKLDSKNNLR